MERLRLVLLLLHFHSTFGAGLNFAAPSPFWILEFEVQDNSKSNADLLLSGTFHHQLYPYDYRPPIVHATIHLLKDMKTTVNNAESLVKELNNSYLVRISQGLRNETLYTEYEMNSVKKSAPKTEIFGLMLATFHPLEPFEYFNISCSMDKDWTNAAIQTALKANWTFDESTLILQRAPSWSLFEALAKNTTSDITAVVEQDPFDFVSNEFYRDPHIHQFFTLNISAMETNITDETLCSGLRAAVLVLGRAPKLTRRGLRCWLDYCIEPVVESPSAWRELVAGLDFIPDERILDGLNFTLDHAASRPNFTQWKFHAAVLDYEVSTWNFSVSVRGNSEYALNFIVDWDLLYEDQSGDVDDEQGAVYRTLISTGLLIAIAMVVH